MRFASLPLIFGLTLALASPALADGLPGAKTTFVQVKRDGKDQPTGFQTAVTHFSNTAGNLTVDLIAVVHFGEHDYYADLNRRFKRYDAVLFEMVGPDDPKDPHALGRQIHELQVFKARHPEVTEYDSQLSKIQNSLARLLGLEFQLDDIDYGQPNFIHADISPKEFSKSLQQHGESIQQILIRAIKASLEDADETDEGLEDLNIVGILLSGSTQHDRIALRRVLAKSFKDLRKMNDVLEGPGGSTLIAFRNKRVVAVLDRQLKQKRHHFAIFYGAAHMPDLERRLSVHYGLSLKGQKWLTAWDLRYPTTP